jgi:hypothetical protein
VGVSDRVPAALSIVADVPDAATAEAMAAEWPGLDYPGHAVEVMPAGPTTPEAGAGGG